MIGELKDALSALKEQLVLSEKVEQNKSEILKLRQDFDKLEENFAQFIEKVQKLLEKHLGFIEKELQNIRQNEANERKILLLEIENMILKSNQSPKRPAKKAVKGILPSKSESK